jgi:hypothetical protein
MVPVLVVPVCLLFFIFGSACSREDQPPGYPPSPKVVQTIQPPPEEQEEAAPDQERAAERPEPHAKDRLQEETPPEEEDADVKEVSVEEKPQAPADEKPETLPDAEQAQTGVYVVRQGDTLAGIAARQEIMEDPLKWLTLLRLNREKFGGRAISADFANRELPSGMVLRFISPGEAKERVEKPSGSMWAVNVISASASTEGDVVTPAVMLAREGFPAYLTRAQVKGKEFLRLRVGFFSTKSEAVEEGEKIRELLGLDEFWVTMVSAGEYEEWAGLAGTP